MTHTDDLSMRMGFRFVLTIRLLCPVHPLCDCARFTLSVTVTRRIPMTHLSNALIRLKSIFLAARRAFISILAILAARLTRDRGRPPGSTSKN